jgi:hypothetical protein
VTVRNRKTNQENISFKNTRTQRLQTRTSCYSRGHQINSISRQGISHGTFPHPLPLSSNQPQSPPIKQHNLLSFSPQLESHPTPFINRHKVKLLQNVQLILLAILAWPREEETLLCLGPKKSPLRGSCFLTSVMV